MLAAVTIKLLLHALEDLLFVLEACRDTGYFFKSALAASLLAILGLASHMSQLRGIAIYERIKAGSIDSIVRCVDIVDRRWQLDHARRIVLQALIVGVIEGCNRVCFVVCQGRSLACSRILRVLPIS